MRQGLVWIEASAGTGKTYTLTKTVVDLVLGGQGSGQILLVTFTRKAAEELKTRIRQGLQAAWKKAKAQGENTPLSRLEKALEDFPLLTIQTIHGFCNLALTAFPLESGLPFETEMLGAREDRHRRVRALVREKMTSMDVSPLIQADWKTPDDLVDALEETLEKDWFGRGIFQPDETFEDQWDQGLKKLENEGFLADQLLRVRTAAAALPPEVHDFFPLGAVHKSHGAKTYQLVKSLETQPGGLGLLDLLDPKKLESLYKWFPSDHRFYTAKQFYNKTATPQLLASLPRWSEMTAALENFLPGVQDLADGLMGLPASQVRRQVARFRLLRNLVHAFENPGDDDPWKESDGLNYDRMVRLVHQRVCLSPGSAFAQALADRWTTALIDEFQDTDRLQWEIFQNLFDRPGRNLILVGDPKQSIYGFRGADLKVYAQARDSLEKKGGHREVLQQNFRSTAPMIETANRLFGPLFEGFTPSEKGTAPGKVIEPVHCGGQELPPLWLVSFQEAAQGREAFRRQVFRQCVKDMIRLLDTATNLGPQDILVLTDKNSDSAYLLNLLAEKGIPGVAASDQGVFQSPQARGLLLFLQALENPRSPKRTRALILSSLFPPLAGGAEEALLGLQDRLLEAQVLHLRGAYLEAFRLLQPSKSTEGGSLDHILSHEGGERAYTNILHLLEILQEACRDGRFTAGRAAAWFEAQMETSELEEINLRIDRDSPAVRIMTIHKAKGLEAPVVFFCAGLGVPKAPEVPFSAGGRADFLGTDEGKELAKEQVWQEKIRLFYVAFTRPRALLWAVNPPSDKEKTPWDRFMALTRQDPDNPWDTPGLCLTEETLPLDYGGWKTLPSWNGPGEKIAHTPLVLRTADTRGYPFPRIASHTSLVRELTLAHPVGENAPRENDEQLGPVEADGSAPSGGLSGTAAEELPAGADFGTLVHTILEVLDFRAWAPEADPEFLAAQQGEFHRRLDREQGNRLGRIFQTRTARARLWDFLGGIVNLPLPIPGVGDLRLSSLAPSLVRRELEFHLKWAHQDERLLTWERSETAPEHLRFRPGYLTGWIDLIFQAGDRYFIADWKTNRLTPGQSIEGVMGDSYYDLQALLYAQAVRRFPRLGGKTFGGVVYLFLRNQEGKPQALFLAPDRLEIPRDFQELFPAEDQP